MTTSGENPIVRYEFALLEWLRDEPLLRAAALSLFALLLAAVIWWYWRERRSVRPGVAMFGGLLRLVAIGAVAAMVLGPQRRTAEVQTRPSKVVLLVDTSLSMSLPAEETDTAGKSSRIDAALRTITESPLLPRLAEQHAVEVVATDGNGRWHYAKPSSDDLEAEQNNTLGKFDWQTMFVPEASETRLGDAVTRVVEEHTGRPLAGVVLLSDGQSNGGRDPLIAAASLGERGASLHAIGFGPVTPGVNLAVRDVVAPSRAYPSDALSITTLVEATGSVEGARASLYRRAEGEPPEQAQLVDTQPLVTLSQDNAAADTRPLAAVDFRQLTATFLTEPGNVGRYIYTVRVPPLNRELTTEDNTRDASVEVVDRVLKVLLLAGGPTRDYRFLRDQLRRDNAFELDVLLQSLGPGARQDATNTLTSFPATEEAVGDYDVIVAFDPDWRKILGAEELVEHAVSKRGAGLLYAPGPVNTPRWLGSREPSRVQAILPVVMPDRWLALSASGEPSRVRSPIEITPAGADAEFLWIAGSRTASLQAWRDFAGFYRCFPIQSVKPVATVYARTDSRTGGDAALAGATGVMLAEQFYGAGRVMVLSSSELWRLRQADPTYFTTLTTKLLQHLAQGRLAANSPGGSLLFERSRYRVGETVLLRATGISGDPDQPLDAELVDPDGDVQALTLQPSEDQPGSWSTRWNATAAGRVEALVRRPVGGDLRATTEVSVPALERSSVVRNGDLLQQMTTAANGNYYPTLQAALEGEEELPPLVGSILSRAETTVVFGQPDPRFAGLMSRWALGLIAGCLILEWIVRRSNRLA